MRRIWHLSAKCIVTFQVAGMWLILWYASAGAAEPFFTGLGDLAGGAFSSSASGVSADGSVVVGSSRSASGSEAFRWTQSGGMVGLGGLAGLTSDFFSEARGVSDDGSVVVGSSLYFQTYNPGCGCWQPRPGAFRWTQAGGMTLLGDFGTMGGAIDVSADGSVVVGSATGIPGGAFRWTQATGMEFLTSGDAAYGVSADGSVVVGSSSTATDTEAFRWTQTGGIVGLGDLPGGSFYSSPHGISADGMIVVGTSSSATSGYEAFHWMQSFGMIGLGVRSGFDYSWAQNVSDGSVVVGFNGIFNTSAFDEAFLWDAVHGMRSLREALVSDFGLGVSLAGWELRRAEGISPDGQFIVGSGKNPSGNWEAWLARIELAPTLPGDYDGNGTVGPEDYDLWKANFGSTTVLAADGNGDGIVNAADYTVWRNHLGDSLGAGSGAADSVPGDLPGGNSAVPEPASMLLLVFGTALFGVRRGIRRRASRLKD